MTACIVFDFDGVLVDSNTVKREAYYEIFAEAGPQARGVVKQVLRSDGRSDRYGTIRGILDGLAHLGISPGAGGSDETLAHYAERYNQICEEHAATCPEIPGASATLARLSGRYGLFVISATPEAPLRRIVERRGWAGYFRAVLGGRRSKSDNLAMVLEREQVRGDEVVFVGDGQRDLDAAQGAGCRFIGVRNPFNDFDPRGLLLVSDLRGLPALIETPPGFAAAPTG
jgi:phosphoglycolate phosphatase-like HAD superfamily hydrolase